jgi:hypothetical protein
MTHWIKRIRYEWQIKVYNSQTGKLVNQKTFQGFCASILPSRDILSACPALAYFRGDKPTSIHCYRLAGILAEMSMMLNQDCGSLSKLILERL